MCSFLLKNDYLVLFSETGSLPIEEKHVKLKGRLEPGKILLVDTEKGRIISNDEIKETISKKQDYKAWNKNIIHLND
jgi:hypothetical protein